MLFAADPVPNSEHVFRIRSGSSAVNPEGGGSRNPVTVPVPDPSEIPESPYIRSAQTCSAPDGRTLTEKQG